MGIFVMCQEMIGFGFAIHIMAPAIELVVGPFVVLIGNIDAFENLDDE